MRNEIKKNYRAAVDILQSLQTIRDPKIHDLKSMTPLDDTFAQCQRWQRKLELAIHA